jgi:16S rRNA processing protein RimM
MRDSAFIVVGQIGAPHGVKGWVKIQSYTELTDNLLDYEPWYLARQAGHPVDDAVWQPVAVLEARAHGKGLVARLEGCDDRDTAALLRGRLIAIRREQLPKPAAGEYYWVDLEGLRVVNREGIDLGVVDHLLQTGANDVLVVRADVAGKAHERLIPFVKGPIVQEVDLKGGVIRVDWGADYD